jgi:hypothetical protein
MVNIRVFGFKQKLDVLHFSLVILVVEITASLFLIDILFLAL